VALLPVAADDVYVRYMFLSSETLCAQHLPNSNSFLFRGSC
jgi:hypothetical protein